MNRHFVIQIKSHEILLIIPGIILILCCSSISPRSVYNAVEMFLPYFNLIYVFLGLFYIFKNKSGKFFLTVLGMILVLGIICLLNGTGMGSFATFLTCIFGLYYIFNKQYEDNFLKYYALLGFIYLIISIIKVQTYYMDFTNGLDLVNPNTICLNTFLFMCFFNAYMHIKKNKIIQIAYNIASLFVIEMYKSRTVLFVSLIYIICVYFLPKKIWTEKMIRIVITLVVIGGVFFPLIYINIPNSVSAYISTITHKSFYSGREIIWSRFFDSFQDIENIVIGPGGDSEYMYGTLISIQGNTMSASMHNSYLGIMLNYGIIGIVFYLIIVLKVMPVLNDEGKTKQLLVSLICGYIMCLIIAYTEVLLIYSYSVICIHLLLGMSFAVRKQDYEDTIIENSHMRGR